MALSTYLGNKLLELQVGKTAYTLPTTFLGLSSTTPVAAGTGVTEPSTGGYARVATAGVWGSAASESISNTSTITFPTPSADWASQANMTYFVLYDAATGGNLLAFGAITNPGPVLNGVQAYFSAGQVTLTIA